MEQDLSGALFEARILRPLAWFGLIDIETTVDEKRSFVLYRRYRKTDAFDGFISCDVVLDRGDHPIH